MSKAIKELERIFFPVKKVEATNFVKTLQFASSMTHLIICDLPNGSKMVVNTCSEDYGLVSNKALFTPIVQKLEEAYEIEPKVVMRGYSKFYVDFIIKDLTLRGATKKDMIFPRLRVNNSYDGSVKFSFSMGFYRVICSNGMVAAIGKEHRSEKWMHTLQIDDNRAAEEVLKKLGKFMSSAKEIVRGYDCLIGHGMSINDAIKRIEEIQKEVEYPKKLVEHAIARLTLEANQLKEPINDYLVYNAMNHALYQTPDKEQPEHKRDKTDIKVLDWLLAENN